MGDDITNIKTHEGWLHLRDVIEMFSRRVVDRTYQRRVTTELALQARLMAVWRARGARNCGGARGGRGGEGSSAAR